MGLAPSRTSHCPGTRPTIPTAASPPRLAGLGPLRRMPSSWASRPSQGCGAPRAGLALGGGRGSWCRRPEAALSRGFQVKGCKQPVGLGGAGRAGRGRRAYCLILYILLETAHPEEGSGGGPGAAYDRAGRRGRLNSRAARGAPVPAPARRR